MLLEHDENRNRYRHNPCCLIHLNRKQARLESQVDLSLSPMGVTCAVRNFETPSVTTEFCLVPFASSAVSDRHTLAQRLLVPPPKANHELSHLYRGMRLPPLRQHNEFHRREHRFCET